MRSQAVDVENFRFNKGLIVKVNQDFIMAVETVVLLKQRKSKDYLDSAIIAEKLDFSLGSFQKVIQTLGRRGIIESKRGRLGGIRLRNRTITLLDLWTATCGGLDAIEPAVSQIKKPLKAFSNAMAKVIVCKKS